MAHVKYEEDGTPYLSDDWYIEDVVTMCERMNVTLTADEMETVLHNVADGFDANYGITWDSFEWGIQQVVDGRKKEDE